MSANKQDLFIQEKIRNFPEFMKVYLLLPNREAQYSREPRPHIKLFDGVMSQNHVKQVTCFNSVPCNKVLSDTQF